MKAKTNSVSVDYGKHNHGIVCTKSVKKPRKRLSEVVVCCARWTGKPTFPDEESVNRSNEYFLPCMSKEESLGVFYKRKYAREFMTWLIGRYGSFHPNLFVKYYPSWEFQAHDCFLRCTLVVLYKDKYYADYNDSDCGKHFYIVEKYVV